MIIAPPHEFIELETCDTPEGVIVNAQVKILREVFQASDEQINEAYTNQRWKQIRVQRDKLLAETDWWANSDIVMTDERKSYRQALRDITSQENPDNITWPTKPK